MLAQAAISIANTERRVLDRDALAAVQGAMSKGASYEVTVVDRFYTLAQRSFQARGMGAVWERRFATGGRGRPKSIDVSLFGPDKSKPPVLKETRLEFGLYSRTKLQDDATKLYELRQTTTGLYNTVRNLVILWEEADERMTAATLQARLGQMMSDAQDLSPMTVQLMMVSGVDLFTEAEDLHRTAYVGLFQVA